MDCSFQRDVSYIIKKTQVGYRLIGGDKINTHNSLVTSLKIMSVKEEFEFSLRLSTLTSTK